MKTLRQLFILTVLSVMLLIAANAYATPPIGTGQTIEFASSGVDVGSTGHHALGVAMGDLDNDGDLDIVSTSIDTNIVAWQNDGTPFSGGTWASWTIGSSTDEVRDVALGDLDNDGDLDIITGSNNAEDYEVIAWRNNGNPFTSAWTQQDVGATADTVMSVVVADLDQDGYLDIVSSDWSNALIAWQNDSTPFNGLWGTSWTVGTTTVGVRTVEPGDLDNDGDLDLVSVTDSVEDYEVIAWRNNGNPFASAWTQRDVGALANTAFDMALGDLDNDGDLDIISGDNSTQLYAWQNDGTPWDTYWTSQSVGNTSTVLEGLEVGDLDNDGDLDVVVGDWNGRLYVHQNDGTPFVGSWAQQQIGTGPNDVRDMWLGDLDSDGDLDIVSGHDITTNEIVVWENKAVHRNAPFADSNQSLGTIASNEVSFGDVDGDGDLDAFVANNGANEVWLNTNGVFTNSGQSLGTADSRGATLADVDNDGDLDVFVANNGVNTVWTNAGGIFTDSGQTLGAVGEVSNHVDFGDLDGDGDLDALVANSSSMAPNPPSRIYLNTGGTFTLQQSISSGNTYRAALGDLDGDGDLDAFFSNGHWLNSQPNEVWLYNKATGLFVDSGQSLGNDPSQSVDLGDVDGDGDLDAYVPNRNTADVLWINNGPTTPGNFSNSGQSLDATANYAAVFGDVDGDGDLDVFLANRYLSSKILMNDGAGTLTDSGQALGSNANGGTHDGTLGDVDGDGDLDVFEARGHGGVNDNRVYVNQGGSAGFVVSDTSISSGFIPDGVEDDVMEVVFTHNGIAADRDLELNYWNVDLLASDCNTALTSAQANSSIAALHVRLDDGNGNFDTSDTQVGIVSSGSFSLDGNGAQTISFANDNSNVQVTGTNSKTYWISFEAPVGAGQLGICARIDPDADMLVEGKTPDFSVSVQDSTGTTTTNTPTAVSLQSFSTTDNTTFVPILIVTLLLVLMGGVALRRRA